MSLRDIPASLGIRVFVDRYLSQVQDNPAARLARGQQLLLQWSA
jgi:hypothetical protein